MCTNIIASSSKEEGKTPIDFSKFQVISRSVAARYMQRRHVIIIYMHLQNNIGKSTIVDSIIIGSKLLY